MGRDFVVVLKMRDSKKFGNHSYTRIPENDLNTIIVHNIYEYLKYFIF